jgi:chromosomal replication initiator protein
VTDGVFTIPLFADICLEDFEPAGAPISTARPDRDTLSHAPNVANGHAHHAADRAVRLPLVSHSRDSREPSRHEDCFIAGPENRLLAEAVRSLLEEEFSPYNPLLLCGPPGTGKSHIARGLERSWRQRDRDAILTNGADFARDLAAAIENETIVGWRARQRDTSLFILEEVNQSAGKRAAVHELVHIIDTVQARQGQIVLTSRLPPERMSGLPPLLAGRLVGGLVVHLALPGPAARLALIERFAALRRVALPKASATHLAESLQVTPPELFGAVTELAVEAAADGEPIRPERVRAFLAARRGIVRPTLRSITALAAKYFGLKVVDLTSPTRRRAVVRARNTAVYLARQLTDKSLEEIGRHFGGRDHTTVLHGFRMIEKQTSSDPDTRQAVAELRRMLAHG